MREMQNQRRKRKLIFYFLIIVLLIFDQMTKTFILSNYKEGTSYKIFGDILYITMVKNTGSAFGILQQNNNLHIFLTVVFLTVIGFFYKGFFIGEKKTFLPLIGLSFIIGCSLGNLVDRVSLGYVVDFIDFKFWPVFNFADTGIVIGVILVLLGINRDAKKERLFT